MNGPSVLNVASYRGRWNLPSGRGATGTRVTRMCRLACAFEGHLHWQGTVPSGIGPLHVHWQPEFPRRAHKYQMIFPIAMNLKGSGTYFYCALSDPGPARLRTWGTCAQGPGVKADLGSLSRSYSGFFCALSCRMLCIVV